MKDEIKEIYVDSMDSLHFSGQTKEKMLRVVNERYRHENGGKIMKAGFRIKSAGLIAAACTLFVGVTAFAASGYISRMESHNRVGSEVTAYEDFGKIESATNFDILTVGEFENGYVFDNAEVVDAEAYGESGNKLEDAVGAALTYKKDGMADLHVYANAVSSEWNEKDTSIETRIIDGIEVRYGVDEYLFLPADQEGKVSQELLDRQENDDHFFISYGTSEKETKFYSHITFVKDGVHYSLSVFDTALTADDFYEMASQLITKGE